MTTSESKSILEAIDSLRKEIKEDIACNEKNIVEKLMKNTNERFQETILRTEKLEQKVMEQENRIEKLEKMVKRKNLIIYNLNEERGENLNVKLISLVNEKLGIKINENDIEFAYRLGKMHDGKCRPIILGVTRYNIKIEILKSKVKLKGSKIYINDDLPEGERKKRTDLYEKVKELKEIGENDVKIKSNKIFVGGVPYVFQEKDKALAEVEKRRMSRSPETTVVNTKENKQKGRGTKKQRTASINRRKASESGPSSISQRVKSKESIDSYLSDDESTKTT